MNQNDELCECGKTRGEHTSSYDVKLPFCEGSTKAFRPTNRYPFSFEEWRTGKWDVVMGDGQEVYALHYNGVAIHGQVRGREKFGTALFTLTGKHTIFHDSRCDLFLTPKTALREAVQKIGIFKDVDVDWDKFPATTLCMAHEENTKVKAEIKDALATIARLQEELKQWKDSNIH